MDYVDDNFIMDIFAELEVAGSPDQPELESSDQAELAAVQVQAASSVSSDCHFVFETPKLTHINT